MFNDIFSLANSFGICFGLKGSVEPLDNENFIDSPLVLKLEVDEFHKKYISDVEAREIFELVTTAFIKGSMAEHRYCGARYEFDCENLTVVEFIDKGAKGRGEWL